MDLQTTQMPRRQPATPRSRGQKPQPAAGSHLSASQDSTEVSHSRHVAASRSATTPHPNASINFTRGTDPASNRRSDYRYHQLRPTPPEQSITREVLLQHCRSKAPPPQPDHKVSPSHHRGSEAQPPPAASPTILRPCCPLPCPSRSYHYQLSLRSSLPKQGTTA